MEAYLKHQFSQSDSFVSLPFSTYISQILSIIHVLKVFKDEENSKDQSSEGTKKVTTYTTTHPHIHYQSA